MLARLERIGVLFARRVERRLLDDVTSPAVVGYEDDLARRRVRQLEGEPAVAHLLVGLSDVLQPGLVLLEVLQHEGQDQRIAGLELEGLGVE